MDSQRWSSFEADEPSDRRREEEEAKKKAMQDSEGAKDQRSFMQRMNWIEMRNRLVFGGLVGFTTGATFGAVDAAREMRRNNLRVNLSSRNVLAKAAGVSGGAFAGFFLTYQGIKTALEVQRGKEDMVNAGIATVFAGLPFIRMRAMRQNVPYALMLVALDYFNVELSEISR